MHILVCVKQVPDSREIRIDPKTQTLIREGVPSIVNIYDQHAIEAAVRLKQEIPDAEVTALSMGPPMAAQALKECVALGVDRAVLVSDRTFAGADTLATSYVLGEAAKNVAATWGALDLVVCGKQTLDGDTGQVGPGLACRLGFEQLTYVEGIEALDMERRLVRVHRHLEHGVEVVETRLPAVLTVTEAINRVHRASLPAMLRAVRYTPITWTLADFPAIDRGQIGLKGSPTVVGKAWVPKPTSRSGERVAASGPPDATAVVARLFDVLSSQRLPEQLGWATRANGTGA